MKSKKKNKSEFLAGTRFFTREMLDEVPVRKEESYRVKWTKRVAPLIENHEDFKTIEEAQKKFVEIAQNLYYVDLVRVIKTSTVIRRVFGGHV